MRIGAGWQNTTKKGETYISAEIDEALKPLIITDDKKLKLFTNKNKTEPKHPDYIVCLFKKDDEQEEDSNITQFM